MSSAILCAGCNESFRFSEPGTDTATISAKRTLGFGVKSAHRSTGCFAHDWQTFGYDVGAHALPLSLLLGHSVSHDAKCFSVGQGLMLMPISEISPRAADSLIPSI